MDSVFGNGGPTGADGSLLQTFLSRRCDLSPRSRCYLFHGGNTESQRENSFWSGGLFLPGLRCLPNTRVDAIASDAQHFSRPVRFQCRQRGILEKSLGSERRFPQQRRGYLQRGRVR